MQPSEPPSGKTLIMIHGRGWKPDSATLEAQWRTALGRGLDRDWGDAGGSGLLEAARIHFVYYGDLTNAILESAGQNYDPELDLADREQALRNLSALGNKKQFRRQHYEAVPGKSSLREFLVDVGAPLLSALHLTDAALSRRMPEVAAYFDQAKDFGSAVRTRLAAPLQAALQGGEEILLISHCLGSVAAYDVLWELSHERAGPRSPHLPRLDTWITLGSPLADEWVKHHLAGHSQPAEQRYPSNLINWMNVAAEDDYTCHDETMANDYARMLQTQGISQIRDYRIYNLAVRYGRSNPHHAAGYLIHPRVSALVADWLQSG
jgi:hypothetical protein